MVTGTTGITTPTGQGTDVDIFATGDYTQVADDLRTDEQVYNLPQVPVTVIKTVPGGDYSDTSGLGEFTMDTQESTGIAGGVRRLYIYDAPSLSNSDVVADFNQFEADNLAKAGSASFSGCEVLFSALGLETTLDQIFLNSALQGQTVFASTGDTGGFCAVGGVSNGVPAGVPDDGYPAASPYVVDVGGTTLYTNNDGSYYLETPWVGGGGGPSLTEPQPSWQNGVVPLTTTAAASSRGLPDVSMDADFVQSPAVYYENGAQTTNGGTSLASPLALGVWARLESEHNNSLGFASPYLYCAYQTPGFRDVLAGTNGPYPATPGWDYATGLGSFDIARMETYITANPTCVAAHQVSGAVPTAGPTRTPEPTVTIVPTVQTTGTATSGGAGGSCQPLWTDPTGDAPDPVTKSNDPQLDLVRGDMSTNVVSGTLQVRLTLANLSKTVTPGTASNNYYMTWTYNGTAYFAEAEVDALTGAVTYSDGTVSGGTYNGGASTGDTGSFTPGPDGVIEIDVPLANVGNPASMASLVGPAGHTFIQVGVSVGGVVSGGSLQAVDNAGPGNNYTVGQVCQASGVGAGDSNPTTTPEPGSDALYGTGLAALLLVRRRSRRAARRTT